MKPPENNVVLILGGCRSGKSNYALQLGEQIAGSRVIIATAVATDADMAQRIATHKLRRDETKWTTIEEPSDIASVVRDAVTMHSVILIDCLTVWIATQMHEAESRGASVDEAAISEKIADVLDIATASAASVLLISNEVGLGVHPETSMGRTFRDLAGRCNQLCAAAASSVILMTAGIPLSLKPQSILANRHARSDI